MPQPSHEIGRGRSHGQDPGQQYERRPERVEVEAKGKFAQHHGASTIWAAVLAYDT
ncbi:hypothetical protein X744_15615 [Mesorhizobium sp. LNJC372A00]|nr:hypothetical protein X773_14950 [Mesorhizobium sp. LSJC285A00]ESX92447.1 hypothetical protein X755_25980 [Mesorhizobium sp. LNJC405B00]ESY54373.1 hypothetical protein X745_15900 [Mesorhizobium sp. LNJC374B00]ESY59503.1 hypothetical protein X744_15615 [Mesorhizobium sp. LNJC372A00]